MEHTQYASRTENAQLALFLSLPSSALVGFGTEGEREREVMLNRKSRIRIHHSISDVCLCELWLAGETDADFTEIEDAYCRIQARMLTLQAILWPQENHECPEDYDAAATDGP